MFNRKSKGSYSKGKSGLWMVAGVYLLYLSYNLITDPEIATLAGSRKVLIILAIIAFIFFGIYFIVNAARDYMRQNRADCSENEQNVESETDLTGQDDVKEIAETTDDNKDGLEK